MYSDYKLDSRSVKIVTKSIFTKTDQDLNQYLSINEMVYLMNKLYEDMGMRPNYGPEEAGQLLEANGIGGNRVSFDQFEELFGGILGQVS